MLVAETQPGLEIGLVVGEQLQEQQRQQQEVDSWALDPIPKHVGTSPGPGLALAAELARE